MFIGKIRVIFSRFIRMFPAFLIMGMFTAFLIMVEIIFYNTVLTEF